jgi:hypothetical protein
MDLTIFDIVAGERKTVGEYLATENDDYDDDSPRVIFIVLRHAGGGTHKYSINGTTVKNMLRSPDTKKYYRCIGPVRDPGTRVLPSDVDRRAKILQIDLGQKIAVPYKQIENLIKTARNKAKRIFFAVPNSRYDRTISEGVFNGTLDYISGYHCQVGSSIDTYTLELCSDQVCTAHRSIPESAPMPAAAPAATSAAATSAAATSAAATSAAAPAIGTKRRRDLETIMEDRNNKVAVLGMLMEDRDLLLRELGEAPAGQLRQIQKQLEEKEREIDSMMADVDADERRMKRKLDKESAIHERVRQFEARQGFFNEFRSRMMTNAIDCATFLQDEDGTEQADEMEKLKKLFESIKEYLE